MPGHLEPIFHWSPLELLAVSAARLGLAVVLGGLMGIQRERVHSAAGLRTHILVGLGAALFVLAEVASGAGENAMARVIQGVVAGIGFLGAGTILKIGERVEVHGLTTAASIWVTAAIGVAAGLGHIGLATVAAILGFFVLGPLARFEKKEMPGPPPLKRP
jgi:putative Mg2+ transporter-C (MgtC) family protein